MTLRQNLAAPAMLAALLSGGIAAGEAPLRKPLVQLHTWPGEGVPVIAVDAGQDVPVYSDPRARQPMKTVLVRQAHTLEWDESRVLVLKLGRFEITGPVTAEVYLYGGIDEKGNLLRGHSTEREFLRKEEVDVVSYLAEGSYLFSHDDVYFEMFAEDKGRFLREPETEWWVRVKLPEQLAGWVQVDGKRVKGIDRKF